MLTLLDRYAIGADTERFHKMLKVALVRQAAAVVQAIEAEVKETKLTTPDMISKTALAGRVVKDLDRYVLLFAPNLAALLPDLPEGVPFDPAAYPTDDVLAGTLAQFWIMAAKAADQN